MLICSCSPILKQEYSESAELRQGGSEWLTKFTVDFIVDFLVQRYISGEISMNIWSDFLNICAKLWENALSCNTKEWSQKFLNLDSEADDFKNLMVLPLLKDTSLVKFLWWSHESFHVKLLTHRQADNDNIGNMGNFRDWGNNCK